MTHRIADPFFLIVADTEREVFSVEGPMTDSTRWHCAVLRVQDDGQPVELSDGGSDRAQSVADYKRESGYTEVPSGSIVKPGRND